jgi:nickel/cobalt transporter (NicO) family protein
VWEIFRSEDGLFDATFVRLLDDPASGVAVTVLGLLIAVGVGAVHALGPGHGKALIGAYLAGTRGRARDAVALGVLVAAMHSGSVLVFGFAMHATQRLPGGDGYSAVLHLLTGTAIAAVGAWMLARRLRLRRSQTPDTHVASRPVRVGAAGDHDHGHEHGRGHGHAHGHDHHHELPDGVAPLSRAGVVALASSGGLLPSPAAFLVLVTALAIGRAGYGVALVGAFSVGLAATLTAIGLAVLWGRDALVRTAARRTGLGWATRNLPLAASVAVLLGGVLLAGSALHTL